MITGAALGLPGTEHIFDDGNIGRLLRGEQFIHSIPARFRAAMIDKQITRLVKTESGGNFETLHDVADAIKLAGRGGAFDLQEEFGVSADRVAALDRVTQLAIGVGLDALRDAGIPLVMRYKTTTKGTQLPDRWGLPDIVRDDTGVIFGSAFPGYDSFADIISGYFADHARREQLDTLENLRAQVTGKNGDSAIAKEIEERLQALRTTIEANPYVFDRRFLLRVLSMGHSQFAELIGARGPNTQINSACATTAQAVGLAEDWIRAGRCRRVIIISADDVTSDHMLEWFGAGFLASGAAATDGAVEDAAIPFDRRRHGLLMGMGAAALVVESADAASERGIQPICEVLSTVTANSAFHGTRLDVQHIGNVMESLVHQAETKGGISRQEIAPQTVFVSHETYTPARGGSASAEVNALRHVFGGATDQIVIANTKGFTGHAMATGIEDVLAVKALETGLVPPVPNFKEVDPELGPLNLSQGGAYPVQYAIHLGAGFGSQVSMVFLRWTPAGSGVRPSPDALGYAYRIADTAAWDAWVSRVAGRPAADMEVVHRTLRVRDGGPTARIVNALPETKAEPVQTQAAQRSSAAAIAAKAPVVKPAPVVPSAATKPATIAPAAAAAPSVDPVKERILALMVEKTGYPPEMLDFDLDLEADLGVDTVKQAELFAAVREIYNIPRDENRKLRDYPTLSHVIRFVYENRPDLAKAAAAAPSLQPAVQSVSVAPPAAATPVSDSVKERILALVVEKTGYPPEMLDLDLDLEADLGVDTVKQAELFAAIREIYNIPRDENRKLRDYPTLSHVIRFVYENRPDLVKASRSSSSGVPLVSTPELTPAATIADPIMLKVLEIAAEKTGYPPDMLDLDLDLEADLGVDTVKQAEMFAAIRAAYNIPRDENLKLRDFPTLAHVIQFARERADSLDGAQPSATSSTAAVAAPVAPVPIAIRFDAAEKIPRRVPVPVLRPPLSLCKPTGAILKAGGRVVLMPDSGGVADALTTKLQALGVEVLRLEPQAKAFADKLKEWSAAGPIKGLYWLPALDDEGPIGSMDLATWRESLRVRVKSLYLTAKALYEQVGSAGGFLVSATCMGGQHGYDIVGARCPLGGAVTGFTKTFKRERPDATVKVVDFEAGRDPAQIADALIAETLNDPGAVEIGYKAGLRWTVALQEQPVADGRPGMTLTNQTLFLVTGAAGSIVSAITTDLAAASGGIFYLLDIVPEPDPASPDIQRFGIDKEGVKLELAARFKAAGKRVTPAMIEKELAALERAHAAQSAIDAVKAAGGTAYYFSVNLADAEAVVAAIEEVRARHGRIDVLLHAAGIERSHFLPDKDPKEFDLVFDVKADGWFNLLNAIGNMPLGATVAFSSVAGRFGNAGQCDYSAANDLLCKITSSFRTTRPETRGTVIDWTAWGGIGMATRGSIPKMMELAGIDMLPPEAGVPFIRRELTSGGACGEVVVANRLGILLQEFDSTGGLDIEALERSRDQLPARGPMVGKITGFGIYSGLTMETTLTPSAQPFLNDHRIDGTPVLPGVMGIEAFAEAALCAHPGWYIETIEEVNFLAPFKFYKDEPRTVLIEATYRPLGDCLVADCRLIGKRLLPGQPEPQVTAHFTARVRLTRQEPEAVTVAQRRFSSEAMVEAANIYRIYFHGPAYQVLERAWWDGEHVIGEFAEKLPDNHYPADQPTLMLPRLIELCFQTAGIWEMGTTSRMGLPSRVQDICACNGHAKREGRLYAVVTPRPERGSFDAEVVDTAGKVYIRLKDYSTAALPAGLDAESLKPLRAVFTAFTDVASAD